MKKRMVGALIGVIALVGVAPSMASAGTSYSGRVVFSGGYSNGCDQPRGPRYRRDYDRGYEYGRHHRRQHRALAGTLYIDGQYFPIGARSPRSEVARAFRRCGYRVKSSREYGRKYLRVYGTPKVHWIKKKNEARFYRGYDTLEIDILPKRYTHGGRHGGHGEYGGHGRHECDRYCRH